MVGPGSKPSSTLPCVLLSTGQGDKEPLNGLQAIAGYRVIIDILCMMYRYLCIKKWIKSKEIEPLEKTLTNEFLIKI